MNCLLDARIYGGKKDCSGAKNDAIFVFDKLRAFYFTHLTSSDTTTGESDLKSVKIEVLLDVIYFFCVKRLDL